MADLAKRSTRERNKKLGASFTRGLEQVANIDAYLKAALSLCKDNVWLYGHPTSP
jgi:hypothetical protein